MSFSSIKNMVGYILKSLKVNLWSVTTFTQVFMNRPDCTFQEIMAWSLFGFPSGPLPVYISFSIKETTKTAGPTAPFDSLPKNQLSNCSWSY